MIICCIVVVRIALSRRCQAGDQCADVNAQCSSTGLCQCVDRFHNLAGICGTHSHDFDIKDFTSMFSRVCNCYDSVHRRCEKRFL